MPVAAGLREQILLSLVIAGKFNEATLSANRESPLGKFIFFPQRQVRGKGGPNAPDRPIRFEDCVQEQAP